MSRSLPHYDKTAVIPAAAGLTAVAVDLGGDYTLAGIEFPTTFSSTLLYVYGATSFEGTYRQLFTTGGGPVVFVPRANSSQSLNAEQFASMIGWRYLKFYTPDNEGATRTITLITRMAD
jgi:hypothetical protein